MIFAYWKIRGLAQPIRLLLEYTGEDYDEVRYESDSKERDWFAEKPRLGLDFPNLPYLLDGDVKLTQSNAIVRYIGRRHNLLGETPEEIYQVDVAYEQIVDNRSAISKFAYAKADAYDQLRTAFMDSMPLRLRQLSDVMGDKKFLASRNISVADFTLFEFLDACIALKKDALPDFPNLIAFHERFKALPKIAAYMKSDRYIERPFNNQAFALWY